MQILPAISVLHWTAHSTWDMALITEALDKKRLDTVTLWKIVFSVETTSEKDRNTKLAIAKALISMASHDYVVRHVLQL